MLKGKKFKGVFNFYFNEDEYFSFGVIFFYKNIYWFSVFINRVIYLK